VDDLNIIRQRLAQRAGPEYWRCLEELADSADFKELVSREAPRHGGAGPTPSTGAIS
jgi:molybdopterin-containing oxidoreductase family iron-sulfur binding subunit